MIAESWVSNECVEDLDDIFVDLRLIVGGSVFHIDDQLHEVRLLDTIVDTLQELVDLKEVVQRLSACGSPVNKLLVRHIASV